MVSKEKTVDEYLKTVPKERQEASETIRELCLEYLKGYDETMAYGGPCYKLNGIIEAGFVNQKNFIGVYILKQDALVPNKHLLKGPFLLSTAHPILPSLPQKSADHILTR